MVRRPLAATAQLAVSVARTDPAARLQRGMTAAGLGPFRLTLLAAASTALTCALGVLLALIAFLTLRGDFGTAARTAARAPSTPVCSAPATHCR
ncbi:hypothetical protein O1L55_05215 [Streptomyces albulus]|nr:hypothetical protein [Streptomyces noursei]